ncbi:MAG: hypothetical protein VKJ04_03905 [Vampirovibrionales bacterium]|nr:hypothetical protein [Vampirovibrionales bacterium]
MTLKRLLILTGDPSADMHAAHIVDALRASCNASIDIHAVGGTHLQAKGTPLISDQSKMARVGFGSVLGAFDHWRLGQKILKHCQTWMPQAILFIDYGVFHLWLASELKKRFKDRCPKLYYFIPPQVWATRRGRLNKIKRHIDHVFCIFPFEKALYEAEGIPVTYVGHPLSTQLPPAVSKETFCQTFSAEHAADNNAIKNNALDPKRPIIGIFPGSRHLELDYLLAPMVKAAALIQAQKPPESPEIQFVIARSSHFKAEAFEKKLAEAIAQIPASGSQQGQSQPVFHVFENANHAILSMADAVILASGTVTLEAAFYGTPLVLIYKLHPIIYQIAVRLLQLPFIGLPNILCCIPDINRAMQNSLPPVVPEFWQDRATPEAIAGSILPLLDPTHAEHLRQKEAFQKIRQTMQNSHQEAASVAVARALLDAFPE